MYSLPMAVTVSGWVMFHASGSSPSGSPAACSIVPVAPSRIVISDLFTGFAVLSIGTEVAHIARRAAGGTLFHRHW